MKAVIGSSQNSKNLQKYEASLQRDRPNIYDFFYKRCSQPQKSLHYL